MGLLGRSPREWREFFQGDKKDRVKLWFNHFVHNGRHTRGARAICNFALAHRDEAWGWIVWTGKHAQSPVVGPGGICFFFRPNSLCSMPKVQPIMLGLCPIMPNHADNFLEDAQVKCGKMPKQSGRYSHKTAKFPEKRLKFPPLCQA